MAKVHFAPFNAIKYVGSKAQVFHTSLARPKPTLKKGDIIIVDKVTAFNLVNKGFGEFVKVEEIEFATAKRLEELELENKTLKEELDKMSAMVLQADGE